MKLSNEQYEYIEESILDTFESSGINSFPIDVFDLCKKLNIKVKKYTDCSETLRTKFLSLSDDAFNFYNPKTDEFEIFYNDSIESARLNFSVMHEIGHIQLNHKIREISDKQKETEADIFAQKALAPVGVILKLGLKTDIQISSKFDISLPCSRIIISNLQFLSKNQKLIQKEKNSSITNLFEEAINAYINK